MAISSGGNPPADHNLENLTLGGGVPTPVLISMFPLAGKFVEIDAVNEETNRILREVDLTEFSGPEIAIGSIAFEKFIEMERRLFDWEGLDRLPSNLIRFVIPNWVGTHRSLTDYVVENEEGVTLTTSGLASLRIYTTSMIQDVMEKCPRKLLDLLMLGINDDLHEQVTIEVSNALVHDVQVMIKGSVRIDDGTLVVTGTADSRPSPFLTAKIQCLRDRAQLKYEEDGTWILIMKANRGCNPFRRK